MPRDGKADDEMPRRQWLPGQKVDSFRIGKHRKCIIISASADPFPLYKSNPHSIIYSPAETGLFVYLCTYSAVLYICTALRMD